MLNGDALSFLYTCKSDFLIAKEAEDAVVELCVSAVALVHFSQNSHQLSTRLSRMRTFAFVCWQLMKRTLPRTANALVLALSHPGNTKKRRKSEKYLIKYFIKIVWDKSLKSNISIRQPSHVLKEVLSASHRFISATVRKAFN